MILSEKRREAALRRLGSDIVHYCGVSKTCVVILSDQGSARTFFVAPTQLERIEQAVRNVLQSGSSPEEASDSGTTG
jgi:hypothetical protein